MIDLHPHVEEGRSRYRQGCRCQACKASWRTYIAELRAAKARSDLTASDLLEGQVTTYPGHS